ncbi:MAG TPA: Glu/Leu/Phe/Val dehydrogenase dimerization domain-containing protein, partial [Planctomycetota bacterium]|nr:Glu/Leu/Phe/Val dehydrogenase dimerization domain-containing protein [Planctomycetota bacterium]
RGWIAIHDTSEGPAFGGVRRYEYRSEAESMMDCLRLARAMTHKCRLAELPAGGAKAVLLDEPGVDWPAAYAALGRIVERMGGRFYTGPDVGTGEAELEVLAAHTRFSTDPGPAGPGELEQSTAEGVFRGIGAALHYLDGGLDWSTQRIVVQGLGAVGMELARRLMAHGAKVAGSDIDPERLEWAVQELGIEGLDPNEVLSSPCDVLAPCAMGGLLHDLSLEKLRTRVVAGAANNVLARTLHGDRLHARGVLHVPDFVLNSGALIRGTIFHLEGRREPVSAIGERVARMVTSVLEEAGRTQAPPTRVARRMAERRLAERRASR